MGIKEITRLNEQELERGGVGSWHDQYRDSAYIKVGSLPYELTEGDIITVFSQYGEILDINLIRDRDTGNSKGTAFLMYEDQRSTVLAVDNFNGAVILGRSLRVDHVLDYKHIEYDESSGKMRPRDTPAMSADPRLFWNAEDEDEDEDEKRRAHRQRKEERRRIREERERRKQVTYNAPAMIQGTGEYSDEAPVE